MDSSKPPFTWVLTPKSAMEAAGLVLGVIPVAIQGLNTYRKIVSSIKSARRDLDCLIRGLETEHTILQNTCEILLKGIAPDSVLTRCYDRESFWSGLGGL